MSKTKSMIKSSRHSARRTSSPHFRGSKNPLRRLNMSVAARGIRPDGPSHFWPTETFFETLPNAFRNSNYGKRPNRPSKACAEVVKKRSRNRMKFRRAGGGRSRDKKPDARNSKHQANGRAELGSPPEPQSSKTESNSAGRFQRTRRLFLAALRVWELKRGIRE